MRYFIVGLLCFSLGVIAGHSAAWNHGYEYAKQHFKHSFETGLKEGKTFSIAGWDKITFYPRLDNGITMKGAKNAFSIPGGERKSKRFFVPLHGKRFNDR